ncbi:MAG TPA: NAD-dependent epimerase/dehydratase family protein, partial [Paracoccus sp. (in: a-proteobacteria)]|nr:NAD-dependent epimerase/dehydratase family protein [Paracoccus sp. (in: a-proteobacteria)]
VMTGMDCVYNLAKSTDKSWEAALENDVATTERIGRAALRAGVGRLVHTGTIASYDMSAAHLTISEATDFGDMEARNIYARSKAEGERRLIAMTATGLPLVIARPGIVLGDGGPLQHWGIGRWHGAGAVRLWGSGKNILPFVLADDVSDGLILMMTRPEAIGQSFNLIGDAMFSGRDY